MTTGRRYFQSGCTLRQTADLAAEVDSFHARVKDREMAESPEPSRSCPRCTMVVRITGVGDRVAFYFCDACETRGAYCPVEPALDRKRRQPPWTSEESPRGNVLESK